MAKRLLTLALILALLAGLLPASVRAAEPEECYITVYYGRAESENGSWSRKTLMKVYQDGDDFLFSAQDLALLSGFEMEYDDWDQTITFTRNYKEIIVHLEESSIECQYGVIQMDLPSQVQYIGGEYYLSGAGMLPWLSVRWGVQDGTFMVIPIPVSYWDLEAVGLNQFDFRLSTCARILGMSEKDISALAYTEKSNASIVLDFLAGGETSLTDTQEFYDLFYDFFMDRSATAKSVGAMNAQNFALAEMTKDMGQIVDFAINSPQVDVATNAMDAVLDATMNIVKIMTYTSLYKEDNSLKISMMQSLIDNRHAQHDPEMIKAARQIKTTFTDYFKGVTYHLSYMLLSDLSDAIKDLGQPEIMDLMNIAGYSVDPDDLVTKRLDSYMLLSDTGLYIYNCTDTSAGSRKALSDAQAHAMLYLYAVEQAYRTFAQYVIDNKGTWDQLEAFWNLAGPAEEMYGKYLAASAYLNEDICTLSHVKGRIEKLKKEFSKVTVHTARIPDIARAADQGMYLAALMDMGVHNMAWDLFDPDGDGAEELLITGYAGANHRNYPHENPSYILLDSPLVESITTNGAATSSYLITDSQGRLCVREDYTFAPEWGQTTYIWNGRQWFADAQHRHFMATDIQGNPIEEDIYHLSGVQVDQQTYEKEYRSEFVSPDSLSCPDLLDRTIPGSWDALIRDLDAHLASVSTQLSFDADQDEDKDRLYLIQGAADRFTKQISDPGASGVEVHLNYADTKTTLLLAENTGSGVRLRICRVEEAGNAKVSANSRGIAIGDTGYRYCPLGAPFVPADNRGTLMDFMIKTPHDILQALDRAALGEDPSVMDAQIGGGYARFNFRTGISTAGYLYNDAPDYGFFTESLPLNLPVCQFRAGLQPTTEWTPAEMEGSGSETVNTHFSSQCFWFDRALSQVFRITLSQRGRGPGAPVVTVRAELVTEVSDELRRQLGIPEGWKPYAVSSSLDLDTLLSSRYIELETMLDSFTPEPSYPAFVSGEMKGVRIDMLFPDHGNIPEYFPEIVHISPQQSSFTIRDNLTTDMDMEQLWCSIHPSYGWTEPFPQYGPMGEYLYDEVTFYYLCQPNDQIYLIHLSYKPNLDQPASDYSAQELRQMVEDYFNQYIAGNGETYVIFEDEFVDGMNECTFFVRGQFPNADAANILVANAIVNKDTGTMTIDYFYESSEVQLYVPVAVSPMAGGRIIQITAEWIEYPSEDITNYFFPN